MRPERDRLWRLVGEESGTADREHGGGVEVVSLFRILLESALDQGHLDWEQAETAVRKAYAYKSSRLATLYPSGDPFIGFTIDGIDQLVEAGLLREAGPGRWEPTDCLVPGRDLPVIPGKGRGAVSVIVYPEEIRRIREGLSNGRMNAASVASLLHPSRSGLRKLSSDHVAWLADSMREHGFLPELGVLRDQHGRIIDGRHRLAAAKAAGVEPIYREVVVDSDEEAVVLALVANQTRPWSSTEWRRLSKEAEGLSHKVRDELRDKWIEWEIRNNPRSQKAIAKTVGCSDHTVAAAWREIERAPKREGAQGAHPPAASRTIKERVEAELVRDPRQTNVSIAEALGCHEDTAKKARARLVGAGAIPDVPRRERVAVPPSTPTADAGPAPAADSPRFDPDPAEPRPRKAAGGRKTYRPHTSIEWSRAGDSAYMAERLVEIGQQIDEPLGGWLRSVAAELVKRADRIARAV